MKDNDELKRKIEQGIKSMSAKPYLPDRDILFTSQQAMANSAMTAFMEQQEIDEAMQEIAERNAMRDRAIQRTAKESVEHTRLLEQQLQEVQSQNAILRIEAAKNKEDAEASRKATRKANRLSIWAIVLSTILGAGSIVASVLIALYL